MAPEELLDPAADFDLDCDAEPGELRIRSIRADEVDGYVRAIFANRDARVIASGNGGFEPVVVEHRLLHWVKTTNPQARISRQPPTADVKVLMPASPDFEPLRAKLDEAGIAWRQVRYWLEDEVISTVGPGGEFGPLQVVPGQAGTDGRAARDAFELMWHAHANPHLTEWTPIEAGALVPGEWVRYLPFPTFNPAQAEAAPVIADSKGNVIVTAPTGAGKTVIGMLAVIKALVDQGSKAAWLVPQRSLTDELERELASWKELGLKVERLSGEQVTDLKKIREAHLWVATTEKFESVCRTASMREALAEVACLVVDEIHLLGDPVRGPLLEALLARVRGGDSGVRIVGLSATVANAADIATWLGARLVATSWRPSRLTWQLPVIRGAGNRAMEQTARTEKAVAITELISRDNGSVLVFCGSKRNVRATALAIAAARGADTRGVHADDLDRLERVCTSARVGIHYKEWEYKSAAERGFRARELDVLVATTTVAAGVNLPARAVVVRDTQLGTATIGVATVQQMFGRAGRVGAGESEGWAYLVVAEEDRSAWQQRLVDGYTVRSQIAGTLPDHLLAEAAQGRIHSVADAEQWWLRTLADHQGTRDVAPVHAALDLLCERGFLTEVPQDDDTVTLAVTELGTLTTRLMVGVQTGTDIASWLAEQNVPDNPDDAERFLARAVGSLVPQFAEAPVADELRPHVARLRDAGGHPDRVDGQQGPSSGCDPGDLAQVAFLLVANSPEMFTRVRRSVGGIPASILYPILTEAPRYFAWLAEQGRLGTVHPWIAVTAADLGRRIRWRASAPPRGAGRLLWICEQMATREHADRLVPQLYDAARRSGVSNPDWPIGGTPRLCRLDRTGYVGLLRDRCTGADVRPDGDAHVVVEMPTGSGVVIWAGDEYRLSEDEGCLAFPAANAGDSQGVAVFSPRGDYHCHGWAAAYNGILP
ncbi:DEAD/DEAH box helicase [Amycolatopsis sp. TNS106]|uniref:DEAD/DEAH box helicase n=1 Tax=Amycolatopsis sp. TNS106 TaxID=2861750 RepID=UPI001C58C936|nr:DEAD/DEAH box helicase [Amycolatopsis sp. TNS106]QXV61538.1 DEAD/DEAH box helicase [Amycolatopsis sp. TNS106]